MLTVYKASAGSGKTFRLAVEYIKHLIIDDSRYERILAVTFTNKATEEMKMRILSQLYGLAHNLPDSRGYMDVLLYDLRKLQHLPSLSGFTIDESFVAQRSEHALHRLLHNYHYFRVQTIDKFFQTVLRNLAHELDLTPNLRVELGDKEVEHQAVDSWIDRLKDNDKELNWILDYVRSSMDDNKAWNVIDSIKSFGESLLKDDYKKYADQLSEQLASDDDKFYDSYVSRLRAIARDAEKHVHDAFLQLWTAIEQHGWGETSFKGGTRGVGVYIKKLTDTPLRNIAINKTIEKCLDLDDTNGDAWVGKKASSSDRDLCLNVFRPLLIDAVKCFTLHNVRHRTAAVTLANMSKLRLLRAIQKEINESNALHDRFLLSDTQMLLHKMIDGSDTPFIFEKIGSRIDNIMIDEFQDTSRIQWQNFKVLLNECMHRGTQNLIVGDVKQSIYRWRSGDWRLLHNISQEFPERVTEKPLNINRRSSTSIIDFNNAFFSSAIDIICSELADSSCKPSDVEMLRNAYADVRQYYPEGKQRSGYVEVQLFDKEDYDDTTYSYITDTITRLIHSGVKQKDIAILVRTNKYIPLIASYCMARFRESDDEAIRQLSIVSDEAFLLGSSPAVNIIIDAIRLLLSPDDKIIRARLSMAYQQYILATHSHPTAMLTDQVLPEPYLTDMLRLRSMPLYQLCETLYSIFSISQLSQQSAFVCYFFDCLTEFLKHTVSDISEFISYWDETMCNKKVESDSGNGIRILSIHKSKGLEYAHVILPFCDWKLELASLMWCQPSEAPFNELPVIPLSSSKNNMLDTIYEPYYWEEHIQNVVDNINLLYVAFTRAKDGLFISTQAGQGEGNRGHLIEQVLQSITITNDDPAPGSTAPEAPHIAPVPEASASGISNIFTIQPTSLTINVRNSSRMPEFRESNQSREFTLTNEDTDEQQRSQYIQLGNVLHSVFANIRTADDIPAALLQMEMDGLLFGQDITAEALHSHINRSLANPQVADWFSSRWTLYNECTILAPVDPSSGIDEEASAYTEHRPDRVMTDGTQTIVVDFKLFSFKPQYRDQVRRYVDCLRRMGYPDVKGYLWLVMSDKVIEVK